MDGTDFVHPDAVGADLKHTFKVISLDRDTGRVLWERVAYEGPVHDSRHKKASFASSIIRIGWRIVNRDWSLVMGQSSICNLKIMAALPFSQ
ncbi:MAG TPA: hypothetical protein VJ023_12825 [Pyrinomonadaceae bacterium]|nr:hypothetical protein [Pyrinomonadaceae bacterium]